MDLEAIAPIIEQIIKDSLSNPPTGKYKYGYANNKGTANKVASGKLRDSVKVQVVEKTNETILQVMMLEYSQYVQSGRISGKGKVPIKSLLQWIKDRKLKGRSKKGRYISNLSFAFAIQTNIKKFGIRPAGFIDVSIESIMSDPRITELIGEAAYDELINAIEGI
jgi:hypothetical protein